MFDHGDDVDEPLRCNGPEAFAMIADMKSIYFDPF